MGGEARLYGSRGRIREHIGNSSGETYPTILGAGKAGKKNIGKGVPGNEGSGKKKKDMASNQKLRILERRRNWGKAPTGAGRNE